MTKIKTVPYIYIYDTKKKMSNAHCQILDPLLGLVSSKNHLKQRDLNVSMTTYVTFREALFLGTIASAGESGMVKKKKRKRERRKKQRMKERKEGRKEERKEGRKEGREEERKREREREGGRCREGGREGKGRW